MIVSIVKGKCKDISSVSQRVEGVGEGRIVNYSDGSFLNYIFIYYLNVDRELEELLPYNIIKKSIYMYFNQLCLFLN